MSAGLIALGVAVGTIDVVIISPDVEAGGCLFLC